MSATIEFSAQFGGRDAAAAALPHFKALKAAANRYSLARFPFKSMAFILRVDGEVNSYGLSGPGQLDFDGDNYVSVDIGIGREDYRSGSADLTGAIVSSLKASVDFLTRSEDVRLREIDFQELQETLIQLCDSYEEMITD